MKRVFAALVILTSLSCLAQVNFTGAKLSGFTTGPNNQPAVPPTPTTLSGGEVPLVWYQGLIGTNSSVETVTNLASSGTGYDWTNSAATSKWLIGDQTINSKPAMRSVTSARYLKNDAFTNSQASGFVIGCVISITNIGFSYIWDSTNSGNVAALRVNSGNLEYYDGSGATVLCGLGGITNTPISLILVAPPNGANSFSPNVTLYTNGVSAGAVGSNPTTYMQGLLLGNRAALDAGASFVMADLEAYKTLTAGSITDLHTYHHNTFGVP